MSYKVETARSRLRDPANRSNTTYISKLLADKVIDSSWNNPTPEKLSASVGEKSSPILIAPNLNSGRSAQSAVIGEKIKKIRIIPSRKYNPLVQSNITPNTKLTNSISLSKFFNTNPSTDLAFFKAAATRIDIVKYLYLHALIMKLVKESDFIGAGLSLIPTEGVYEPTTAEVITKDSINYKKALGKAVVYKVVNNVGEESLSNTWKLASELKDIAYFDELILSYDTLEKDIRARLIFVMPDTLSDNWEATFRRKLSTQFNFNQFSANELVEVAE